MKSFLIITLAMNGYQLFYRNFIKTHQVYARRIGAKHVSVSRPWVSTLGVECCWLKLHLLKKALEAGYDDVLILDADTKVNTQTPDIRTKQRAGKYVYMAKGYSQRFNSGVLWVQNHKAALEFIDIVINSRLSTVPLEDEVGWGENGHIIHHAKKTNIIGQLETCWNNTYNSKLVDYIRHYNHGPFRRHGYKRWLHKLLARLSRGWLKIMLLYHYQGKDKLPSEQFEYEVEKILLQYPQLIKPY